MELKHVILIGIAMSMDALGLSISLGINPHLVKKNKIKFILSFSFFHIIYSIIA